ncbi:MAG: helix-turn-helix domain-containing protein [Ruminococcus sp.]|nr:helix-turn-helix domain-containing protein [Ruminococcus sp.]MBQ5686620.1 helix-turn-helix domain-containing protein [Ruminococcus sp.]
MPTIGERLALIRQNAGLTMTAFAEKLNLSKSTISLAENNKQALSVRVIVDICEKFNIRREWLETGEGEMHEETKDSVMRLMKAEYNLDDIDYKIISLYLDLSPKERAAVKEFIAAHLINKIGDAD